MPHKAFGSSIVRGLFIEVFIEYLPEEKYRVRLQWLSLPTLLE
jgi:hypothetical protein